MNYEEIHAELSRIEQIDDLYQQGYQSAPIIALISCCSPAVLLQSVVNHPFTDETSQKRDEGFMAWCRDQISGCNDD